MTDHVIGEPPRGQRLRLRYTKIGKVRFLGHRDLCRVLERALRRAELPVARTQGFNPRSRLSFGLALPTGAESSAEYLDLDLQPDADLRAEVDLSVLPAALTAVLPPGVDVVAAGPVDPRGDSLQQAVTSCDWELSLPGADVHALAAGVEHALAADALVVVVDRKGAPVEEDLRPALLSLALHPPAEVGGAPRLLVELASAAAAGGRSVRPSDVARAVLSKRGPGVGEDRARRMSQWIARDGVRREPLGLSSIAAVAPHAEVRAS